MTRRDSGFTLLEVVLALAILMLMLVPLLGAISGGMRNISKMEQREIALRLAQDRMSEIEMIKMPDAEEVDNGDFDEYPGYRWEVESIKPPVLQLMEDQIQGLLAFEVHVRVYWEDRGVENSVELSTLMVGQK